MRYGSIYLIVKDIDKSVSFYEKIFDMKVSAVNALNMGEHDYFLHLSCYLFLLKQFWVL